MAGLDAAWIRAHAAKLDRNLRHEILSSYRPPRYTPCWLNRVFLRWRLRRRVPVIIQLNEGCGLDDCHAIASLASIPGGPKSCVLKVIRAVAAEVPISHIPSLVEDARVSRLTYDRPVRAFMDVAAPAVGAHTRTSRTWRRRCKRPLPWASVRWPTGCAGTTS